jgi:hypothetical protein
VQPSRLELLHATLWGKEGVNSSIHDLEQRLQANPRCRDDLVRILRHRQSHTHVRVIAGPPAGWGLLTPHASYSQTEVLMALGHWQFNNRPFVNQGVVPIHDRGLDVLFVTLSKNSNLYSPTTMYEDYIINDHLFHWQSQNRTSASSPTGQRYIHHRAQGYTPLLFVRERESLPSGITAPYAFLGPAEYFSHEGSSPISITWKLLLPIPSRLSRRAAC